MKNRLRVLRAERNWSQSALASRLGVSRQTVNAIERGKYDPSLPLAFKIAKVFGQQIEEMFRPDADQPSKLSAEPSPAQTRHAPRSPD